MTPHGSSPPSHTHTVGNPTASWTAAQPQGFSQTSAPNPRPSAALRLLWGASPTSPVVGPAIPANVPAPEIRMFLSHLTPQHLVPEFHSERRLQSVGPAVRQSQKALPSPGSSRRRRTVDLDLPTEPAASPPTFQHPDRLQHIPAPHHTPPPPNGFALGLEGFLEPGNRGTGA
jgi:hypothetical protein